MKISKAKFLQVLMTVGPVILMTVGVPPEIVLPALHAIGAAQDIAGASGADKKTHAIAIVKDAIAIVNTAEGVPILDPALVEAAVSAGIDATLASMKAVEHAHTVLNPASLPGATVIA